MVTDKCVVVRKWQETTECQHCPRKLRKFCWIPPGYGWVRAFLGLGDAALCFQCVDSYLLFPGLGDKLTCYPFPVTH